MPAKVKLTKRIGLALMSVPAIGDADNQVVHGWALAAIEGSDVRLWPDKKVNPFVGGVGGVAFYRPRYGEGPDPWNVVVRGVEKRPHKGHVVALLRLLHAAHTRAGLDEDTMKALHYRCRVLADMLKLDPITRLGLVL